MKNKLKLLLLLLIMFFFQACNEACVCTVKWIELHEESADIYATSTNSATYTVYVKDENSTCERALEEQYNIRDEYGYNDFGITYVYCAYKP